MPSEREVLHCGSLRCVAAFGCSSRLPFQRVRSPASLRDCPGGAGTGAGAGMHACSLAVPLSSGPPGDWGQGPAEVRHTHAGASEFSATDRLEEAMQSSHDDV